MRIAILGAGAMGGMLAALLHRAGHDIEVTARGAGFAAIREHGIRLDGAWGEHTAPVTASERVTAAPDLAIITTKAMHGADAARTSAEHLNGVNVVAIQNGLGGIEAIADELPTSPIVGGLSLIAVSATAPGHVTVTTGAGTWLGMLNPTDEATPARIAADTLSAVMPVTLLDNFAGARWTKLLINQVNALPAITGLSVQEVIGNPGLRRAMALSMREAARVGLALGTEFQEVQGITAADVAALAAASDADAEAIPLRLRDYLGDVPNPGSTLQSIRRGVPTEIDYLNGAVVASARRAGLPAPLNARLTELVHEVERTGRHLSADETLRALAST